MRSRYISGSGKLVDFLRIGQWISSARLSTDWYTKGVQAVYYSGQLRVTPILSTMLPAELSPYKTPLPPPTEHYLYPVSTAPTNRATKEEI